MMSVVGVVGVVVVVVGGGGGEQLLYIGSPMVLWSSKIQKKDPLILFFILKAHVWIKCPCMVDSRSKRG